MKLAYLRVSTSEQSLARQEIDADRVYEEHASGVSKCRPVLDSLLDHLRSGDEVHVWSIDRLARSVVDLEHLLSQMLDRGASVHFMSERLTFKPGTSDPFAELTMRLISSVAQFERQIIKQRQKEGIAKAKNAGRYRGRKPSIDRDTVRKLAEFGLSRRQIAKQLGIARSSVSRILSELSTTKSAPLE